MNTEKELDPKALFTEISNFLRNFSHKTQDFQHNRIADFWTETLPSCWLDCTQTFRIFDRNLREIWIFQIIHVFYKILRTNAHSLEKSYLMAVAV